MSASQIFSRYFPLSFLIAATIPFTTYSSNYETTAAAQALANSKPGLRHVPGRDIPVPKEGVSPQEQAVIRSPYSADFNTHPKNAAQW